MPAAVETMFYAGDTPWHGLGVGVEKAKTSAQAIKLAGLDWEVALGPVWAGSDRKGGAKPVEGRFAIYRVSDGQVYATNASERYQPWQNHEAFEFTDSLVQDKVMHYETAGSLRKGARIWVLARLEEGMKVADDDFWQYMLVTSGHDLNGSIQVLPTNVRVVCNNTLTAAISASKLGPKGGARIKIAHQPGMESKLKIARDTLRVTTEANRRMTEWLQRTTTAKLSANTVDTVVEGIFGPVTEDDHGTKRNAVANFRRIFEAEQTRNGRTAYSMVNAITGYADHNLRYNGDSTSRAEARMLSTIEGHAEDFKEKGIYVLGQLEPKAAAPALA